MMVPYYSYAGPASGVTDPEEVRHVEVDNGNENPVEELDRHMLDHTVIMWSGNEYSKNHTWISSDKTVDLYEKR